MYTRVDDLRYDLHEAKKRHPNLASYPVELVDGQLSDRHELIKEVLRRKKVPVAYTYDAATDQYRVYCEPEKKEN